MAIGIGIGTAFGGYFSPGGAGYEALLRYNEYVAYVNSQSGTIVDNAITFRAFIELTTT